MKLVSAPQKPLPKRKIFPFTDLPAELRNKIYAAALVDEDGIHFEPRTKGYRRIVVRKVPNSTDKPASLVPAILTMNHETFNEAQAILYGNNKFTVEDTTALHSFLAGIGSKNIRALVDVTIKSWGMSRGHKTMNHPALTLLSSAVNLRRIHIDCQINWSRGGVGTAQQLYRDGFHFLEAFGMAKGRKDAAIDVIEMKEEHMCWYPSWRLLVPSQSESKPRNVTKEFRDELRKLLWS